MNKVIPFLLLIAAIPSARLIADTDLSDLPDHLSVMNPHSDSPESYHLLKTGVAERRFLFIPIYKMAHYMASLNTQVPVLDAPGPKAVRIVFSRKINGDRIQREFLETIQNAVTPESWQEIRQSARAYADPFAKGDTRPGDTFTVAWLDHGTVVSHFNGSPLSTIQNPQFARALWSVWVGPESVVDRDRLLLKVRYSPSPGVELPHKQ
ncbi:MAG: chalcone isomerase family protein [Oceanipulchritudo sp.]